MLIDRSRVLAGCVLCLAVLGALLLAVVFDHSSWSAQAPCLVGEAAEIHYGPGEDLEQIDVALIGEAARQIDMAAYVLTDRAVIEALRAAAGRGVKDLARRQRSGEAQRVRRAGPARRPRSTPRASVKCARRRAHAPERLLRRSSPVAHRLGQLFPVRRDAPGQRPCVAERCVNLRRVRRQVRSGLGQLKSGRSRQLTKSTVLSAQISTLETSADLPSAYFPRRST
jgi:hypothetical protein